MAAITHPPGYFQLRTSGDAVIAVQISRTAMLASEAGLRTSLTLAIEDGLIPGELNISGAFPATPARRAGQASAASGPRRRTA